LTPLGDVEKIGPHPNDMSAHVSRRAEGSILNLGITTERLTCFWQDNEPLIVGVSFADDQDIGRPVSISVPHFQHARADDLLSVGLQFDLRGRELLNDFLSGVIPSGE
jgi:hypothetical protein